MARLVKPEKPLALPRAPVATVRPDLIAARVPDDLQESLANHLAIASEPPELRVASATRRLIEHLTAALPFTQDTRGYDGGTYYPVRRRDHRAD